MREEMREDRSCRRLLLSYARPPTKMRRYFALLGSDDDGDAGTTRHARLRSHHQRRAPGRPLKDRVNGVASRSGRGRPIGRATTHHPAIR